MLGYQEKIFWSNFINENIDAIQLLIENKFDKAALKLIFCFIDSLSGFYSPNEKVPCKRFNIFLKKYMSNFYNQLDFKDQIRLRKKEKIPINRAGDIIYDAFRNSSIHDGAFGLGIDLYRDEKYEILWSGLGIYIMKINILGFFEYLKKALKEYENDLQNDKDVYNNFLKKFNCINQPVFKSKKETC